MSLYLYGVVRPGSEVPEADDLVQPAAGPLRMVAQGDVAGLVTDFDAGRAAMTPRNVEAHHAVVERAAVREVVLPARFGVIVDSEAALCEEFLAPRRGELSRALEAFEGKVAMRITASYVGDAALREAVASSPGLRRLRRRVGGRSSAAGYYDRIALGELAVQQLAALQERDARALLTRIRGRAVAQRLLAPGEPASTRIAFLVECDRLGTFLQAVERFADEQQGRMTLDVVGPLAPWDFVGDPGGGDRPLAAVSAGGEGPWGS